jgi:hypothetical protein
MAERARAQAAGLDELGIAQGERVAVMSHNSARLLNSFYGASGSGRILVPINFRLVAEEVKYIVEHSGARVFLVDPELADAMSTVECEHKMVIGAEADAALLRYGVGAEAVDTGRGCDGDHQLHERHDGAAKGVQLTHRNVWINATTFGWQLGIDDRGRVPAHPAAVPLQRLGIVYAPTGMGCAHVILRKIDGAEILRLVERTAVTLDVRGAGGRQRRCSTARARRGRATSPVAGTCRSRSPGRRRTRTIERWRPSSAGSSSRSTGSPRRRRSSR